MNNEWANEGQDLEMAEEIIHKHILLNDGEALGLLDVVVEDDDKVSCQVSDWVMEMAECFCEKYDFEYGMFVTKKIISRCIIGHETIH